MVVRNLLSLFLLCTFFFCAGLSIVEAYVPLVVHPTSPNDIQKVRDPSLLQYFYGALDNFPHTYEFTTTEPITLSVEVRIPLMDGVKREVNGIVVKKEGRQGRVVEVTRMLAKDAVWDSVYEPWGGDYYERGSRYESVIDPGTYRVEVSTPDNNVPYVLVLGSRNVREGVSYVEMISRIVEVKHFYGKSTMSAVRSPYVYAPTIILVVSIGGWLLWYRRRRAT
jgi:hypothetical protein